MFCKWISGELLRHSEDCIAVFGGFSVILTRISGEFNEI